MAVEIAFFGLLLVAAVVAMVVRRLRLPYTIALVLAGLLLGLLRPEGPEWEPFFSIHLDPEVLFAIFLPALLYEASLHIDLSELADNWKTITLLAVPGVLLGAGVCGVVTWLGLSSAEPLPLIAALMFGALICATDPIAVIAMLGELGVSKRLRVLLEGESLFNDGTAVVVFGAVAALAGVTHHGSDQIDAIWIARLFLWEVGLGFLIGLAIGVIHFWLTSRIDDHLIETTLTTIAAFGTFLVAHWLHASGVIAVVTAGLIAGNYGKRHGMSPSTRVSLMSFWEYVTFVANSIVFLLIGMEIDLERLWGHAGVIALAWLATVLGRAVTMAIAMPILSRSKERLPLKWSAVIWWGGLHGALSMVLAMSLPTTYEHRALLIDLAFGTVLLSIMIQGLTVGPLVRWLGLSAKREERRHFGELSARFRSLGRALRVVHEQRDLHQLSASTASQLGVELEGKLHELEEALGRLREGSADLELEELRRTREHLIVVQKDALRTCQAEGLIDDETMRDLIGELDEELTNLEALVGEHAK
jgi:CPA1 family monovalent cation:H+ antiporter